MIIMFTKKMIFVKIISSIFWDVQETWVKIYVYHHLKPYSPALNISTMKNIWTLKTKVLAKITFFWWSRHFPNWIMLIMIEREVLIAMKEWRMVRWWLSDRPMTILDCSLAPEYLLSGQTKTIYICKSHFICWSSKHLKKSHLAKYMQ